MTSGPELDTEAPSQHDGHFLALCSENSRPRGPQDRARLLIGRLGKVSQRMFTGLAVDALEQRLQVHDTRGRITSDIGQDAVPAALGVASRRPCGVVPGRHSSQRARCLCRRDRAA